MLNIKRLQTQQENFKQELDDLLAWESVSDQKVLKAVDDILANVKQKGDQALIDYTNKFDGRSVSSIEDLELSQAELQQALKAISPEQKAALETAAQRIRTYAEHQKLSSWSFDDEHGNTLGQKVSALSRAGLYVPGGKAAYPSSVLMNAIPAKVAGVAELIMVVPAPKGELNNMVLAAAAIAGVDRVFTVGGAQAIAALAYGTQTVPAVDKIVGPGNIYVATAKRNVFGTVGIDMIAGPSEILVVCDGKTDPDWIAMDLFSQAEHDEQAQSILITPDAGFIDQVQASIDKLLESMPRKDIISASLEGRGAFIQVKDLDEAIELINDIAPEHLELSIDNPEAALEKITNAGAVFMGRHTPEALGDYCAGPNHVLPTSRTARFASPLGVYDFQKRSSIINCSPEGSSALAETAATLADGEGLIAHKESALYRKK